MVRSFVRTAMLGLALSAILLESRAVAQEYPTRPVTIVVPLAAGTGMDLVARLCADRLRKVLGQPVVIENRPGAALMLAASHVAQAAPDGYTLVISTVAPMTIAQWLYKQINYNPETDFIPISLYAKAPFVLVANSDLPVQTVPDLLAHAKAVKKPLDYASVGVGTLPHLAMEFTKSRFDLDITHVPYRTTPQAVQDIAAGHVRLGFWESGATLPLIKEGKLRALAVTSQARLPLLPEVPPFSEATKDPDFEVVSWHVLLAPAKTPRPIVDRLHNEMKAIMADPEIQKRITATGLIPFDTPSVEGIQESIASECARWGKLIKQLGLEGTL